MRPETPTTSLLTTTVFSKHPDKVSKLRDHEEDIKRCEEIQYQRSPGLTRHWQPAESRGEKWLEKLEAWREGWKDLSRKL